MKVAAEAGGNWAKFKAEMQRLFKLGDGLLTKIDLKILQQDEFSTVGVFAIAFEKMAKKVPGLAEEEQCATFLGHFKNWEASSLTMKAAPGKKLTWAAIKEGVIEGELDQVDIFQMRQARKKRKALDATTSDGRDFKKMIEDAMAQLDAEKEAKKKTMAAPLAQGKAKKAVVQEEEEEEEEEEPEPHKLTKAQRKARNLAQGGQSSGRGQKGHTIKSCHVRRNDEDKGLISTNYDGDIYDKWGYYLDPRTPGGTRKEALRRAEEGAPPAPPAMFRIWQEKEVHSDIRVEEVGENEEVEQEWRADTIKEEPIIVESDDEIEENCWNRPRHVETREDYWRTAQQTMERMEDLIDKVGRYQPKLTDMCEKVKEWKGKEPLVYLYDLGPGSEGGSGNLPNVTTSGPAPRSGMTYRPPSRTGKVPHVVWTRAKEPVSQEEPAKDVPEPSGENEVVDVPEEQDDEDDRLRKKEDEKAKQRAKKRGAKPDTDKAHKVKKKKYVVRVEERYNVEEIMDRILKDHNHLINLKDVLASSPRLRDELRARLSKKMAVGKQEKTIVGVYLLANALLQEEAVKNTLLDEEEVVEPEEGDHVIHEREDYDFEEREIKEAFRVEECEGVYLKLGMLLSCEMRERDACARVLKMRPSFLDLETDLTFEELVDLRARQIDTIEDRIEEAASRTTDSRTKDKFQWDKMAMVRKEPLKVGEVVLLYDSSLEKQWSRKLDKRWLGPYRVTRCGEHGAYQIEELNGTTWKDWVSGSRLKKFVARDEAKKSEWEKRIQDLEAKYAQQAPTRVVDWTEVQKFEIKEQPAEEVFKRGKEVEKADQQEGEEIPLIDKEMLEQPGALAEKGAEVEEFEWRLPAGLTLGHEPTLEGEEQPVEAMRVEEGPPTTQGETLGQQGGQESVGQTMAETEQRADLKDCQESTMPQEVPVTANLRDALGSWATETEPEGHVGTRLTTHRRRQEPPLGTMQAREKAGG
ncbi:hypothetical protein CBR_g26484 [Chara braunii]|uniref:Uncharacterized protein n=1 Tax=Chara braunii TaxID=69332 RepID=A0A388L850_CHABU|nr:hypothetical protein CBR_g26484 [Chara braunii]|eukprot:GBG78454.1 hypothetical protein CBR_g26484 [Chara braunii]